MLDGGIEAAFAEKIEFVAEVVVVHALRRAGAHEELVFASAELVEAELNARTLLAPPNV